MSLPSTQKMLDVMCAGHDEDHYNAHVFLYKGYDLCAAGIFSPEIEPCLLCRGIAGTESETILTEELLSWGRTIHFVACGTCGTRGPWGNTESQALTLWNNAYQLLETPNAMVSGAGTASAAPKVRRKEIDT